MWLTHVTRKHLSFQTIKLRGSLNLRETTRLGGREVGCLRWCPSSLAKLVQITPITMVGRYIYTIPIWFINQRSHNWGCTTLYKQPASSLSTASLRSERLLAAHGARIAAVAVTRSRGDKKWASDLVRDRSESRYPR